MLLYSSPSFGGGGSFEPLNFSLPSYSVATSGIDITKLSTPSSSTTVLKVDDSSAKAAAWEERKASRWAEAEAKEAQKRLTR